MFKLLTVINRTCVFILQQIFLIFEKFSCRDKVDSVVNFSHLLLSAMICNTLPSAYSVVKNSQEHDKCEDEYLAEFGA